MKHFSFYHRESGNLHRVIFSTDDPTQLANNTPKDHAPIEGRFDHLSQRLDMSTGQIVDFIPPPPSKDHVWNPDTRRHQLTAAAQERHAKRIADMQRAIEIECTLPLALLDHALCKPNSIDRLLAIRAELDVLKARLDCEHPT